MESFTLRLGVAQTPDCFVRVIYHIIQAEIDERSGRLRLSTTAALNRLSSRAVASAGHALEMHEPLIH